MANLKVVVYSTGGLITTLIIVSLGYGYVVYKAKNPSKEPEKVYHDAGFFKSYSNPEDFHRDLIRGSFNSK